VRPDYRGDRKKSGEVGMNLRVLFIDDVAKKKVQRILDYALKPENWYFPDRNQNPPGNDFHYATKLDTFRCVFSITSGSQGTFRHLSISIPSDKMPNVIAAFTIAELFGFEGWDGTSFDLPPGWMVHVSHEEHCIVLGQKYDEKAQAPA
jgi:hypothetical protein